MGLTYIVAVVLFLFLGVLRVLSGDFNLDAFWAGYNYDARLTPSPVPTIENNEAVERYIDEITATQQPLLDLYKPEFESSTEDEQRLFLMNAFTPLGIFDPFQNPDDQVNVKGLSNFLLGYYARERRFNVPLEHIQGMVNQTIYYGEVVFKAESFFADNQEQLANLVESMEFLDDVYVIADFGSGLSRYNNFYGDSRLSQYWHVPESEANFYGEITFLSNDTLPLARELTDVVVRSEPVHQIMLDLDIESVYVCDRKIIMIIAGIANNALGYVYNAKSAEEVNCGVLKDRFRISKAVTVGDNWIYWVGK
jgi:hypothetical protein